MPEVPRTPDPLKALEEIGAMFYMEREVGLPGGHKVKLAPLGSAQEAKATVRVQGYNALHFMKAVKVEQLAYAIIEVDGARFDKPAKPDGSFDEQLYEEQVDAKRAILNSWPEGVCLHLFNALSLLQDEVEAAVASQVKTKLPLGEDEQPPDEGAPSDEVAQQPGAGSAE